MAKTIAITSVLTGLFCAVFAFVVETVTELFGLWQLLLVSFISGSLGSLFAQTVVGHWRNR